MWKKSLPMVLALVMVLSLTACTKEPSAQEIVDNVIESFDKIRTYQWDMVMTQNQISEAEGMAIEQIVTMEYRGRLDLENEYLEMHSTITAVEPDGDEERMGVDTYILDGVLYALPKGLDIEEPMWIKEAVSAEKWEILKVTGLENYKELLETAQVEVIGSENVKGVECYVLQLTPEMTQLWQTVVLGGGVGGGPPTIPEEILQEVFSDTTVKQWVAKDTCFLMKTEIDTAMDSTPIVDYLGGEGEEGKMSVDLTLSFLTYNYNQPITIELPQEAEEAIGMTME